MTTLIDLTNDKKEEIIYIVVDELDDNPKLYRRKSDKTLQPCLYICDNMNCSKTGAMLARCTGCFSVRKMIESSGKFTLIYFYDCIFYKCF